MTLLLKRPRLSLRILAVFAALFLGGCDKSSIESVRKGMKSSLEGLSSDSKSSEREGRVMPKAMPEPGNDEDSEPLFLADRRGRNSAPEKKAVAKDESRKPPEPEVESSDDEESAEPGEADDVEAQPEEKEESELEPAFDKESEEAALEAAENEELPDPEADAGEDRAEKAGKKKRDEKEDGRSDRPAPAADAIKSCPNKGVVRGKAPPEGLEQWCEDKKGVKNGPMRKWHKNGVKRLDGDFVDGKGEGPFITYGPDGEKLESREYSGAKLNGLTVKWSKTGEKMLEITYKDGKKDGPTATYDRSGRKKLQGSFANEKKDGVWVIFQRNGSPRSRTTWKDGKKNGRAEMFYAGGEKQAMMNYTNNQLNGPYVSFWKDGKKKMEGMYTKGAKNGTWINYRRNGEVARTIEWDQGSRVARKSRDNRDDSSLLEDRLEDTRERAHRRGGRKEKKARENRRKAQEDDFLRENDDDSDNWKDS